MIKLDENYFLTHDSNNWSLNYEKEGDINPKTNKPTISTNIWYCGNLTNALKRYSNEATKEANDVQELRAILNLAMEKIVEVTKNL